MADASFKISAHAKAIVGYLYGLHYPSLVVDITAFGGVPNESDLARVKDRLADILFLNEKEKNERLLDFIINCMQAVYSILNWPIFDKPISQNLGEGVYRVVFPSLKNRQAEIAKILGAIISLVNQSSNNQFSDKTNQDLKEFIMRLKSSSLFSSNTPNFIKTAHALKIPFAEVAGDIYQYGYGSESLWMESTFTEQTSNLSSKLARNKKTTSQILSDYGIPVPINKIAKTVNDAQSFALRLGYPVVVKPADLDGGLGVSINLNSNLEIDAAYKKALKYSKKILVEKHVVGKDYRLVVFKGKLIWAIERIPAHVVGDGKMSIRELVERENKNRLSKGEASPIKALLLDEEALNLLSKSNFAFESVPPKDQIVFLRSHANIAAGGTPVAVYDDVHPDNAQLAIRASEALRLDLAGIDLLMPDISKSWRDVGGSICEVNAQPVLGSLTSMHVYSLILKKLLPKGGHIPIVLIVGSSELSSLDLSLLNPNGRVVGLMTDDSVLIGGECIDFSVKTTSKYRAELVRNPKVDCIVMHSLQGESLSSGLPFDYIDYLVIADVDFMQRDFIESILPMVKGSVATLNEKMASEISKLYPELEVACLPVNDVRKNIQSLILGKFPI